MRIQCLTAACSVALLIGCGGESDNTDGVQTDNTASQTNGPTTDSTQTDNAASQTNGTATDAEHDATDGGNADDVVREEVNPGQTGHAPPKDQDAVTKIIRQPLDSYLSAQDRIKQGQIKRQADLDELQNGPFKDAEDYINRVLTPLGIELPELPAGQKYVYDSEKEQLMVEKPAN